MSDMGNYHHSVSQQSYDANGPHWSWPGMSTRAVALWLGAAILVLGLLGAAYTQRRLSLLGRFDLDAEWQVPALFSALLLVAALAALLQVRSRVDRPIAVYVFALLLLYGAADEVLQIHESLEERLAIDWQRLYAPAFLVVAIVWAVVLVGIWRARSARLLYIASGLAWVVSQVLEYFQWNGDVRRGRAYDPMMVCEEVLEMSGTAFLLLALLSLRPRPAVPA